MHGTVQEKKKLRRKSENERRKKLIQPLNEQPLEKSCAPFRHENW